MGWLIGGLLLLVAVVVMAMAVLPPVRADAWLETGTDMDFTSKVLRDMMAEEKARPDGGNPELIEAYQRRIQRAERKEAQEARAEKEQGDNGNHEGN